MKDRTFIRCPGCDTVVDPTRSVCPGCGRCLNCGAVRVAKIKQCSKCELPYCDCCGRCAGCGDLRYSQIGPCRCGHPEDASKLESLARYHAVTGAVMHPMDRGCVIAMFVLVAVVTGGLLAILGWFG